MAVITMTQWARIHAKAWLNPAFKEQLEKDPAEALTPAVRTDFGIRDDAFLFNLDDPTYGGGLDESGTEPQLRELLRPDLERVIREGIIKLNTSSKLGTSGTELSLPAKMISSVWVSYPPLYTKSVEHPPPAFSAALRESPTLSLQDWAKIMAYLFIHKNEDIRTDFEKDPARAINTIVKSIKSDFGAEIQYDYRQTALCRLGDPPPTAMGIDLKAIRDNPNAYARVAVRLTC